LLQLCLQLQLRLRSDCDCGYDYDRGGAVPWPWLWLCAMVMASITAEMREDQATQLATGEKAASSLWDRHSLGWDHGHAWGAAVRACAVPRDYTGIHTFVKYTLA